jgi:hypothetical protein
MLKYEALQSSRDALKLGEPIVGDIHDSGNKEIAGIEPDDFVVYAQVAVPFTGKPPEDHRVLNALMSDYVSEKKKDLEGLLHKPVLSFIVREYQNDADYSEILNGMDDYLWDEQVDYIPLLDVKNSRIFITIELMLAMEPIKPEGQ